MRIIMVGAAASGKDYFRDWLANIEPIDISYTTRPMRVGEKEGYTYNYISDEVFNEMKADDKFLEAVEFIGYQYGTSRDNWETKRVFIMTPSGTKHIPKEDRKNCIIVYFDISTDVRKKRLSERSDFDGVERRLKADTEDFKDFEDFNIRVTSSRFIPQHLYTTILNYEKCNIQ